MAVDSPQRVDLENLLNSIFSSALHHQQMLLIHGLSAIYCLPRSTRMWVAIIPVLMAPFEVQWYIEVRPGQAAALFGDFSSSHVPHPDDQAYYVELALNVQV
jgi:hypothetical protein